MDILQIHLVHIIYVIVQYTKNYLLLMVSFALRDEVDIFRVKLTFTCDNKTNDCDIFRKSMREHSISAF